MKKQIHIVASSVGGSGNTRISAELADCLGAVAIDGSAGVKALFGFSGIQLVALNIIDKFITKSHDNSINYEMFFSDILRLSSEILSSDKEKINSVVVDYDSSFSSSLFSSILDIDGFGSIMDDIGIEFYLHFVVPSTNIAGGMEIVRQAKETGAINEISDKRVAVWINSYNRQFSSFFTEQDTLMLKEEITENLGSVLGKIIEVGEWSLPVMLAVNKYLQNSTFSYIKENRVEGCDDFQMGRLSRFNRDFREKIFSFVGEPG